MPKVVFDEDRCKGCELCLTFCPKRILVMADHFNSKGFRPAAITHEDLCNACTFCARMCPEVAIEVYR